jgi:transcriptional regulator with XRE-family HTH domain
MINDREPGAIEAPRQDSGASGIGLRVGRWREQLGVKQLELAERAGMSEAYINRLENGVVRNPKIQHLAAVARALSVPLDALLYDEYDDSSRTVDEALPTLAREPRLAAALMSLLRGLRSANWADREFVIGHFESLASRFGDRSGSACNKAAPGPDITLSGKESDRQFGDRGASS